VALAAAVAAVAFLSAGCRSPEEPDGPPEVTSPAASGPKAEMQAILDAAASAAGARPSAAVTWYTPDSLYDYINGQAEEFKDAGFVALAHAEYKAADATGDAYVEVDLYRMASPEAVAKVMVEPPPDSTADLAPGVRAYRAAGMCEFGAGPYYVRVTARLDPEGQAGLVDALARAIAEKAAAE
jgi:hypothetical protein